MTGPEHFRDAQQYAEASVYAYQKWGERADAAEFDAAMWQQGMAQVHATLALAAAMADPYGHETGWAEAAR
jgi:hypothetical protein